MMWRLGLLNKKLIAIRTVKFNHTEVLEEKNKGQ